MTAEDIAKELDISVETAQKALDSLVEKGLVKKEKGVLQ